MQNLSGIDKIGVSDPVALDQLVYRNPITLSYSP